MKELFAIFGNPVSHSKSPLMHNLSFKGLHIDACYTRYLLKDGTKLKETFFNLGLKGVNITVPHKEAAFHACDILDPFAQKIGVVKRLDYTSGTKKPAIVLHPQEFWIIRFWWLIYAPP